MLFYDSYAILAIAFGQENYRRYTAGFRIVTTIMNLYESYYVLLQKNLPHEAESVFSRLLPFCVDIEPSHIKDAAYFRLSNQKSKLSYTDALGYIIAAHYGIPFLTGYDAFRSLPNVEFVK